MFNSGNVTIYILSQTDKNMETQEIKFLYMYRWFWTTQSKQVPLAQPDVSLILKLLIIQINMVSTS